MRFLAASLLGLLVVAAGVPWAAGPRPRRAATATPWPRRLGTDASASRFVGSSLGIGAAVFLVGWGVTGIPLVALPPAVAAAFLPGVYLGRRRAIHLGEVAAAWPDALRDLSASVAAGMSLSRALEHLADHGPAPIREAMVGHRALARTVGVVAALEALRDRLADPTADRVVEVLRIAHERGGSAVPALLATLADATAEDLRVDEEIRTESLEQRLNARIVFVLPWMVLLLLATRPGPFRDFYASTAGVPVIVLGAVLSGVGSMIVGRMARRPIEPRVLGARS